ncbi:slipin family protein [Baekduia soli]|uniref:Slipin family protein n=1 Tax=Baekduia soli TaxID=496014 RepID=A0A5B8U700_9ACTN|nr:slipin family protein [Baekduia soli]QEC48737.1 slipin family protein [Baekduia soli]
MSIVAIVLIVLAAVLVALALSAIRIVREYERVVVFRLGRLRGARGPGLVLVIPVIERTRWVNLQIDTADIPPQDLITKDNVTIRVEAAVFYRVVDPIKAVVAIRDYQHGVLRIAQTTLRATLGQHELDDLLAHQAAINDLLEQTIDAATEPWGINVVKVETRDVDLPDTMKRAMARQAEAERERRAKIIAAEGEFQAAERLSQAAGVIGREPGALTLRTLQTLAEVASEHNSTLVLPIPIDVLEAARRMAAPATPNGSSVR